MKQKVLLPTLKERQRYLVYRIISVSSADADSALMQKHFRMTNAAIVDQIRRTLGFFESAKAGIQEVSSDPQSMSGVIRATATVVDHIKMAAGMIQSILLDGKRIPVIIDVVHTTGMLNKTRYTP